MSPVKKVPIIISVVCNDYQVAVADLVKPNHSHHPTPFTEPKFVAMYLIRKNTGYAMFKIGEMFGYTKSASCIYALTWIADRILDDAFKIRLDKLEAILPQIYKQHQ